MKYIENEAIKFHNKTLVVGHPSAECDVIMELLHASGMQSAKPLQKQSIEVSEISSNLKKAHQKDGQLDIQQIEVNPIWNGLALDLFMSNIDQKWWGWADCKSVSLLNYWKSVDSKMTFILVYDTPQSFLKKSLKNVESFSEEALEKSLNEWHNYNQELLKFYYRNPECTLLVNTEQVKLNSMEYIEKVSMKIGLKEGSIDDRAIVDIEQSFHSENSSDDILSYLSNELLEQYPVVMNLFSEIQSVASLPERPVGKDTYTPFEAILSVIKKEKDFQKEKKFQEDKLKNYEKELTNVQTQLMIVDKETSDKNELLLSQLMQTQESLEEVYLEKQTYVKKLAIIDKETSEENEILLSQLMQTQESLEEIYLEKQQTYVEELATVKKEISDKNELLLSQLMQMQKEKLESKANELTTMQTKLSSVEKEKESEKHKSQAYIEEERVKIYNEGVESTMRKLSYRLGKAMIKCSKTPFGIFKLPSEIYKANKEFKVWQKENAK